MKEQQEIEHEIAALRHALEHVPGALRSRILSDLAKRVVPPEEAPS